jgi:hypothetical protein
VNHQFGDEVREVLSKDALVKVELDELPTSVAISLHGQVRYSVIVKKTVAPLDGHDMTIRLCKKPSKQPNNPFALYAEECTPQVSTPYLVLVGSDQLLRFCKSLAVEGNACVIRDLMLEIHMLNPRNRHKKALAIRQKSLVKPVEQWL